MVGRAVCSARLLASSPSPAATIGMTVLISNSRMGELVTATVASIRRFWASMSPCSKPHGQLLLWAHAVIMIVGAC